MFHAQYLEFMERARTELLHALGIDLARLAERARRAVRGRSSSTAHYHAPARLNEHAIGVSAEVVKMGRASLVFRQRVERGGRASGRGRGHASRCVDRDRMRPAAHAGRTRTGASNDRYARPRHLDADRPRELRRQGGDGSCCSPSRSCRGCSSSRSGSRSAAPTRRPTSSSASSGAATTSTRSTRARSNNRHNIGSLERIFEAGFREFAKLRGQRGTDPSHMVDGARRAMRATLPARDGLRSSATSRSSPPSAR